MYVMPLNRCRYSSSVNHAQELQGLQELQYVWLPIVRAWSGHNSDFIGVDSTLIVDD